MTKANGGIDDATEHRDALLEVHGHDLMAQLEAMLRHVREYQRHAQQLRRARSGPAGTAPAGDGVAAVLAELEGLRTACGTLGRTLDEAADVLASSPAQRGERPARRS